MKTFIFFILISIVFGNVLGDRNINDFEAWVSQHGKTYSSNEEYLERKEIFNSNKLRIEEMKFQNPEATFGLNKFADLTMEEFSSIYLHPLSFESTLENSNNFRSLPKKALPTSVNWKQKGVVPPVENQGMVESAGFIDARDNIASMAAIKAGTLPKLSLQQLEDCNGKGHSLPYMIYRGIVQRGGLESEASYPKGDGPCRFNKNEIDVHVSSYTNTTNESQLATALAQSGPVTVAVDATNWQFYTGGILSTCGKTPNHITLSVGYSVLRTTVDYWIIQNSWGTDWGIEGMIWLRRDGNDTCGVAKYGSFPVL